MRIPGNHSVCQVCDNKRNSTFMDISAHLECGHILHIPCLIDCFLTDLNMAICPVCFTGVNSKLLKNFLAAFIHSLYRLDLLHDIGVTKYEIVLPMQHNHVRRYYVNYNEIPSLSDQDEIRKNRYTNMRSYILNVMAVQREFPNILKIYPPTSNFLPESYDDLPSMKK